MNIYNAWFIVTLPLALIPVDVCAEEYFNPAFLTIDKDVSENVDLSQFEQHGAQSPGKYEFNIKVNQLDIKTMTVDIVQGKEQPLEARFSQTQLSALGIDVRKLTISDTVTPDELLPPLAEIVPDAVTQVDFPGHAIRITVPQKFIDRKAIGAIDPQEWDNGILSLFSNYSFSGSQSRQEEYGSDNKNYLNLRNGMNIGAWRIRNTAIWSNNQWDSTNTFITRNLMILGGSRFTAGEYWSNNLLFDTFQFKGLSFESDDSMLPDSMKGFAPVIRGIAKTNARIEVKQNGFTVYQDWVPPGSFEINDLHPASSSGDLLVTIYEANGEVRSFQEPYSAVPMMQREGQIKYHLATGRYNDKNSKFHPEFLQGTVAWGLSNRLTAYTGIITAEDYFSGGVGVGLGLGELGSLSADWVSTRGHRDAVSSNSVKKSAYLHTQYAKVIQPTDTGITLEGYFYDNKDYRSFADSNAWTYSEENDFKIKRKINTTINQTFPEQLGELYFSASMNEYWDNKKADNSFTLGYSVYFHDISYNLTFSQTKSSESGGNDRQAAFFVQIPLGGPHSNTWMSLNVQNSNKEQTSYQTGLNGLALENNALAWSVQESLDSGFAATSGNVQANYRSRYNQSNIGYSYSHDRHSQQVNYGMSGGIVAHGGGLTFSQPLGDTFALISTGSVSDIRLEHTTNVSTDNNGYAVIPYLTPYHHNSLAIDPASFSDEVEADKTRKDAVPTKGAVILRRFNLRRGHKALFILHRNHSVVPFGANVTLEGGEIMSMTGDNGEVYLSGLPDKGRINVSWGKENQENCGAVFAIEKRRLTNGIFINDLECTS